MKFLLITLLAVQAIATDNWLVDFDKARRIARIEHKAILLNFSGSDWCGPCIQMHKQIFDTDAFKKFASENVVLVNADFPRLKKNALDREQQKKNDLLAEAYNKKGIFPLTILLNAEGHVLHNWEGLPQVSSIEFVTELQNLVHAGK